MNQREIRNAKITHAELRIDERGFLDCDIHVAYDCGGQGFGGYVLAWPDKDQSEYNGFAGWYLCRLLTAVGVNYFTSLKGQIIRVDADWNRIYRIGHAIKDQWFDPSQWNGGKG